MPQLARVLREDDLRGGGQTSRMDLTPYIGLLETVRAQEGLGGMLTLDEGESQRTEKRRLSIAAKQQGYKLQWRKAGPGELRFVLAEDGQPMPGSRKRREQPTPAEAPAKAARGRRKPRQHILHTYGPSALSQWEANVRPPGP